MPWCAGSTRLRHAGSDKHPTPTSVAHSPNCRKEYPQAAYTSSARSKSPTQASLRRRCHALSLMACSSQSLGKRFNRLCQSSSFHSTPCRGAHFSLSLIDDIGPPEKDCEMLLLSHTGPILSFFPPFFLKSAPMRGPPFSRTAPPDVPERSRPARRACAARQSDSTTPRRGTRWPSPPGHWPRRSTDRERFF